MSWNTCKKRLSTAGFEKSADFKEFVEEMLEIYDKMIMMVEKERNRFVVWEGSLGLNPKIVKFFGDIQNGEYARASGGQVAKMLE